jgi:hypothetical protein
VQHAHAQSENQPQYASCGHEKLDSMTSRLHQYCHTKNPVNGPVKYQVLEEVTEAISVQQLIGKCFVF